jgi:chloramphenicol-sensitive protein RarD
MWGLFPVYFALLDSVSPIEIVAHRVIWSLLFMVIVITVVRGWRRVRSHLSWRTVGILAAAAVLLSVNWLVYVYAVNSDQVVQASLGYFINPLVSVALGVVILHERMRRMQWLAIGIAAIAVLILTISYGSLPWIALILALSFGFYGLLKKFAGIGSAESLTIETALLAPFALILLTTMEIDGGAIFATEGWGISILLILLGPVTALPLLAFGAAANRIPLSTLGALQYLTPILQFLLGVLVFAEPMPGTRWLGFVFVWIALVVFATDTYRSTRQARLAVNSFE